MDLGPNVTHVEIADISVQEVLALITRTDEALWKRFEYRQGKGSVHEDTRSLVLKFVDDLEDEAFYQDEELMEMFHTFLSEALDKVKRHYGYTEMFVSRILFAELKAKGHIIRHVDRGNVLATHHRVHIPIKTSEKCVFTVLDRVIPFREGMITEINNWREHEVMNSSMDSRIHLIFDVIGNE